MVISKPFYNYPCLVSQLALLLHLEVLLSALNGSVGSVK